MFNLKDTISKLIFSRETKDFKEFIKELQKELIKADVDPKIVLEITNKIKEEFKEKKELDEDVKRLVISILYDELIKFIGEGKEIEINKKPFKIMLVGLYGSGKTTTAAKLAHYFKNKGYKVLAVQTDKYRPASFEQLKQLFDNTIDLREEIEKISNKELEEKIKGFDVIIFDTAGRHSLDNKLINEIKELKEKIKPDFTIYVVPAEIGKAIKKEAEAFKEIGVNGIIVTRFDGSAKGGGVLVASKILNVPILFLGTGEKINDLEKFDPKRFLSRILGMGDLESLLEKAKEIQLDKLAEKEKWQEKLFSGKMTFNDLYKMIESMEKMGRLQKLISFIPGLSMIPKEVIEEQEKRMKKWKVIIQSMKNSERKGKKEITKKRIKLIAYGSGTSEKDVKELIKYLESLNQIGKMMKDQDPAKLMRLLQSGRMPLPRNLPRGKFPF
ncbi:MAG: signal recognition particle receptor subunit alpha [Nanoarchaeota archaeon]